MRRRFLILTAVLAGLCLGGCKTPQEGVTNTLGTIKTMLEAPPDVVISAAEAVALDMRLEITEMKSTAIDGRLECRTANGRTILFKTTTSGENLTRLSIKVGSGFGDEALSLRLLNDIRSKL